jgi:hypothetical protein
MSDNRKTGAGSPGASLGAGSSRLASGIGDFLRLCLCRLGDGDLTGSGLHQRVSEEVTNWYNGIKSGEKRMRNCMCRCYPAIVEENSSIQKGGHLQNAFVPEPANYRIHDVRKRAGGSLAPELDGWS